MREPAVKICCITSLEEARVAIDFGASAIGLVSAMPSGPGVIPEERIAEIAAGVPQEIQTFLLTSLQDTDAIVQQHRRCKTTIIQLVDEIKTGSHLDLKKALPDVEIVQVIHVTDKSSIQTAIETAPGVDALLLDSGNPDLETKQLGGTGRTHNWNISREIVRSVEKPVYLAGGLNPENIREAVQYVRPYGVDICSGLRTDGTLDRSKTARFFKEIKNTFKST